MNRKNTNEKKEHVCVKEANYKEKNCSTDALNAHAVGDSKSANGQKPQDVKDISQGIRQCNIKKRTKCVTEERYQRRRYT